MKGNVSIRELTDTEECWLAIAFTSVREIKPQQGSPFYLAVARNSTGTITLKLPSEGLQPATTPKTGLWGVVGRLEIFQNQRQFVVSELRPITVGKYRELMGSEPLLPRAFTIDIETIPLAAFKERAAQRLRRSADRGRMREEQQQRYFEDASAEEERAYQ